jgi:hypothetical protein
MAAYMVTVGDEVASWVFTQRDGAQGAVVVQPVRPLPTPDVSSRFVERARLLYGRGRVDEALRELDQVRLDDQARPDADRLRAELQRVLLAGSPGHPRRPPSSAGASVR